MYKNSKTTRKHPCIERGQRRISREQLAKLIEFFKIEESDMVIAWLSEKILYEIKDEDFALDSWILLNHTFWLTLNRI